MINWKSIISEYNDKPTLLEWLKLVKKALDESVLESVSVNNVDETTITLSFNFADGTKITTPSITLPRGLTGATGATGKDGVSVTGFETVGVQQAPDNVTLTTVQASFSDGKTDNFAVSATNGKNGKDGTNGANGVSVTGFDTVSDEVVGNETLTTVRAHFSDGKADEFVVTATNGKDGAGAVKYYKHLLTFADLDHSKNYYLMCIKSNDETPNEQTVEQDLIGFVMVVEEMGTLSTLGIVQTVMTSGTTITVGFNAATPAQQNITITDDKVTEL